MQRKAALTDLDQSFEARHVGEHPARDRAAGDGEARLGMGAEQVVEQARGEHGIAQPRRGDEQDAHIKFPIARPDDRPYPGHARPPFARPLWRLLPQALQGGPV